MSAGSRAFERSPIGRGLMNIDAAIAQAHLEYVVHKLLTRSDVSGRALAFAARILDVKDILSEAAGPAAAVLPRGEEEQSLEAAVHHLVRAADPLTEGALTELQRILVEMTDHGQR